MNTNKKIISLFLVALFVAAASFSQTAIKVGEPAPAFSVTTTAGQTITNTTYKKKAIMLHFWGTWCPPCRAELPEMNKLAETLAKNPNSDLIFLAVSLSDTPLAVNTFMSKNGYTFTGGLDTTNEIAFAYNIQAVPTSILIGADGKIEKIQIGAMSKSQLQEFVSKYVK